MILWGGGAGDVDKRVSGFGHRIHEASYVLLDFLCLTCDSVYSIACDSNNLKTNEISSNIMYLHSMLTDELFVKLMMKLVPRLLLSTISARKGECPKNIPICFSFSHTNVLFFLFSVFIHIRLIYLSVYRIALANGKNIYI